jgi:hypothetical protein
MICNIPGRICYGSENFGLSSLHDDSVGFAGATPQINRLKTSIDLHYVRHLSEAEIGRNSRKSVKCQYFS